MTQYLRIGQVSELLSVLLSTLYHWLKTGKLKESYRIPGQHRRFSSAELDLQFFPKVEKPKKVVVYCRVSSHDQKQDLVIQQEKLLQYCHNQGHHEVEVCW